MPSDELYDLIRETVPQDYDGAKAFFADQAKAQAWKRP